MPPVASAGPPYFIPEGSTLALDGSGSFDPDGSISAYEWDLDNDGNFDDATGVAPNFDAANLDGPNSVDVSLRVTDNGDLASTATSTVTIVNVAPVVGATGDSVNVGETATVAATFTDPASADTHTAIIDWDDGSAIQDLGAVSSPFNPTHVYASGGTYTVTLTVTDDDGGEGIAQADVTVAEEPGNTAPVAENDDYATDQGVQLNVPAPGILGNDSDDENDSLNVVSVTTLQIDTTGSLGVNPDGSFTYTPGTGFLGTTTFTYRADDGTDVSEPATVSIVVSEPVPDNVAPAADAGGHYDVDEGSSIMLNGTASSDSDGMVSNYEWDLDRDGIFGETDSGAAKGIEVGPTPTFDAANLDGPDSVEISLRVIDDDGATSEIAAATVTIDNVAPTAALANDGPVNEGQSATVSFNSQFDPSTADTTAGFTYSYDFGNTGSFDITGSVIPMASVPAGLTADGLASVMVRARIEDKDGGITDYLTEVTVNNVAPSPDAEGPYEVDEGSTVGLSGSATDPAGVNDTLTYVWDLDDDGIFGETGSDASNGDEMGQSPTFDATGTAGPAIVTVTLRVSDEDDGQAEDTATVNIHLVPSEPSNAAPTADAGGPYRVNESSTVLLDGTGSSDRDGTISNYEWDLDGDGVFGETGGEAANGDEDVDRPTFDAADFDGPDSVAVSLRVIDDDGETSTTATATATINNVAPTLSAVGGAIDEGEIATLSGTISDPAAADSFTVTIDWGDGSSDTVLNLPEGSTVYDASHVYADDNPTGTAADDCAVTVSVVDDDGGSDITGTVVRVNNLDPVVNEGPDLVIHAGDLLELPPSTFTDGGVEDTHTGSVDWGDGSSSSGSITESGGSGSVSGSHSYVAAGAYTVTVRVTDDDTGFGEDSFTVVVEPDTRFLTGGGNISEGNGRNAQRFNWGFTLRCDASHARLQFNDRDAKAGFHLESVESVACWDDAGIDPASPPAGFDSLTLIGEGRWNGVSGARIEVTLKDGGEPGSADTIQIHIWNAAGTQVSNLSATLSGGNHQAHPGKSDG